jgi:hypothetical protein
LSAEVEEILDVRRDTIKGRKRVVKYSVVLEQRNFLLFTGNNYRFNCAQTVAWWLEPWTCTLGSLPCTMSCVV